MAEVRLVGNMMFKNEQLFLPTVIPMLQQMCDRVILMDNGSEDDSYQIAQSLLRKEDVLIQTFQTIPPNFSLLRNAMLEHVFDGEWVLKWDADETPTNKMLGIKKYISKYGKKYGLIAVPIYHMRTPKQALGVEYGYAHMRLFIKGEKTQFVGNVHEQIKHVAGAGYTLPVSLGMAVIHWSYYCDDRLRRKEREYAKVPNSGHRAGTLTRNWKTGLLDLPPNMEYTVPIGWLESIKKS